MNITTVPRGHLHEVLPAILPFVPKAAEWTLGRMNEDDIVAAMFSTGTLLWILFDDDKIVHGFLTTQVIEYPQARHFCVLQCGGNDGMLDQCVDLVFDTFETYARQSGCDGFEIVGRPAWWQHVKARGFQQPQRQYFKDLKQGVDHG